MVCTLQKRILTVRYEQAIIRGQELFSTGHRLHEALWEGQELAHPRCHVALGLFLRK
jgi:hypothetical protein